MASAKQIAWRKKFAKMVKAGKFKKSKISKKKSGLVIVKEKSHKFYPKKPSNMSSAKWNALYKPQYLLGRKRKTHPDGTVTGMDYYRETTLKKAQATKKWLERKWEKEGK